MKKTAAAILAALTLCSCSELNYEELSSDSFDEPTEAEQTYVFTGIPELPDIPSYSRDDTETSSVEYDEPEEPVTDAETTETQAPSETAAVPVFSEVNIPPEGAVCLDVPYMSQKEYPTGCELVSASMLLAYYGFSVPPKELISGGYIGTAQLTRDSSAKGGYRSGDPHKVFIGDPFSTISYGCYSGALISGFKKYLENQYFDVADLSGISLKDLCFEYIDFGEPVVVWATIDMEPTYLSEINTWTIDGTDETFTWLSNEHCYVLVGYSDDCYCFHDPMRGAYTMYPREAAEERYKELGSQAVTIHPW